MSDINKHTRNITKMEEEYAYTEIEQIRNKINLLSAFEWKLSICAKSNKGSRFKTESKYAWL